MLSVFRKELADHFASTRFLILFSLIAMVALVSTYMVSTDLQAQLAGVAKPKFVFLMLFTSSGQFFSLVQFIAFFGPLIGLVMGFDAINRERSAGTLSKLVSQPIYRDAVINGKFLAGVVTITIMLAAIILLITGLGLIMVGVVPGAEEVARILVYLVISVCYVSFWLGLSILFSVLFRSIATSALAAVALWIFFSFFIGFGASLLANTIAPVENEKNIEQIVRHNKVAKSASLVSPVVLYSDSTSAIMDPFRRTTKSLVMVGRMEQISMSRFQNPLPLGQSILVVVPYLTSLLAILFVCFGVTYLTFMRQEIRST
ncbi:MAG: ABC transporter permease [Deltaproteobacteria bacterium]|nr:ABC transporter permease [Deltaproteobacteria bacterium]